VRSAERKVVSPYDATFAIDDPFPESETSNHDDPILDGFIRGYAGAFVGYAREELGFKTDITYALLAEVKWDWQDGGSRRQPSASGDLRELLALNPSLRVLISHGYSDIVTPYAASRYVVNHLPDLSTPNRVVLKLYRGGHMFYTDPASRRAFTKDSRALFQDQATR
jgi:carboxypeptidase C (cathepsin A)